MPHEEKETQVDMYTNYKVFRTAQCCEPYSLKKLNLLFGAVSHTAYHQLRVMLK
jgi:hypothetical protein